MVYRCQVCLLCQVSVSALCVPSCVCDTREVLAGPMLGKPESDCGWSKGHILLTAWWRVMFGMKPNHYPHQAQAYNLSQCQSFILIWLQESCSCFFYPIWLAINKVIRGVDFIIKPCLQCFEMVFMFTNKMKKKRLKCKLQSRLEDSRGEQAKKTELSKTEQII